MNLEDIEKLAKLSRIELSEEEKKSFLDDFKSILDYVGQIKEVITEEPPREAGELRNVMRPDALYSVPLTAPVELLAEAPERDGGYIKVQKVL